MSTLLTAPVRGTLADGRDYRYEPVAAPGAVIDGTLTVWGKGSRRDKDCEEYGVQEVPADGFPGRVWLLLKASDGEVYQTSLGMDGVSSLCTCTAGRVGRYVCKHQLSLKALLCDGYLDGLGKQHTDTPSYCGEVPF